MEVKCSCIKNWNSKVIIARCIDCNNLSSIPNIVVKVNSESEIVNLISNIYQKSNTNSGCFKIKAIGGKLSYNQIATLDNSTNKNGQNYILDLSNMNKILSVNLEKKIVRVQAGMILEEFLKQLEKQYSLTLQNFPVFLKQSIAGVIATASHGHGLNQPCISDLVLAIKYVDGCGRIKEIKNDDNEFGAFSVNLGLLGIIIELEIKCITSELLISKEFNMKCEEYLEKFRELHSGNMYVKAWWFPPLNEIHVFTQNPLNNKIEENFTKFNEINTIENQNACHSECIRDEFLKVNNSSRPDHKTELESISSIITQTKNHFTKFYPENCIYGTAYEIMSLKTIPPFQINSESCVPSENAERAIKKLFEYVEQNKRKMSFHGPVDIRFVTNSLGWLSPYPSGALCFGILRLESTQGSKEYHQHGYKFINEMENIFKELGSRPHWGKLFNPNKYNFRELYPKLSEFEEVRKKCDPMNLFYNKFAQNIFKQCVRTSRIEKRKLKELEVSVLALGGAGIGNLHGFISDNDAITTVRESIDNGVNFIDTSPFYQESERRLGLALSDGYREKIILCTKAGTSPLYKGYDKNTIFKSLEQSRKLLKTDYIDIVLIHDPTSKHDIDQCFSENGALNALIEYKRQGLCKYIGVGVREHDTLIRFIETDKIDVILTYLDYTIWNQSALDNLFPTAMKHNVAVLNGSPLAMGKILSDKTLLPKALKFAVNHSAISATIIGCKYAHEMLENIEAFNSCQSKF